MPLLLSLPLGLPYERPNGPAQGGSPVEGQTRGTVEHFTGLGADPCSPLGSPRATMPLKSLGAAPLSIG